MYPLAVWVLAGLHEERKRSCRDPVKGAVVFLTQEMPEPAQIALRNLVCTNREGIHVPFGKMLSGMSEASALHGIKELTKIIPKAVGFEEHSEMLFIPSAQEFPEAKFSTYLAEEVFPSSWGIYDAPGSC